MLIVCTNGLEHHVEAVAEPSLDLIAQLLLSPIQLRLPSPIVASSPLVVQRGIAVLGVIHASDPALYDAEALVDAIYNVRG
jgi:hypothetical protein